MHVILWSTVYIHILLNCSALCLVVTFTTNFIFQTFCASNREPEYLIGNWIPDIELHCSNNCVTECIEPGLIEVGKGSISKPSTPGESLTVEVSTAEHEHETSVEELAYEYTVSNETHLSRLTILPYPLDYCDNNPPNDSIQNDDSILDDIVQNCCLQPAHLIVLTNWFIPICIMSIFERIESRIHLFKEIIDLIFFEFSITKALKWS